MKNNKDETVKCNGKCRECSWALFNFKAINTADYESFFLTTIEGENDWVIKGKKYDEPRNVYIAVFSNYEEARKCLFNALNKIN